MWLHSMLRSNSKMLLHLGNGCANLRQFASLSRFKHGLCCSAATVRVSERICACGICVRVCVCLSPIYLSLVTIYVTWLHKSLLSPIPPSSAPLFLYFSRARSSSLSTVKDLIVGQPGSSVIIGVAPPLQQSAAQQQPLNMMSVVVTRGKYML